MIIFELFSYLNIGIKKYKIFVLKRKRNLEKNKNCTKTFL